MTQEETNSLLIRIIDEVHFIMWYQELLKIAVEQLSNPDDKTVDRVELLLSSYLDQTEPYFDALKMYFRRKDDLDANLLISD